MKKFFLSSLIIIAVFGMAIFTSCDKNNGNGDGNGGKNDDNGNGNGNGVGKGSILTIKGIPPEYNDKYVYLTGFFENNKVGSLRFIDLGGYEKSVDNVTYFVKISGSEAKVPTWSSINSVRSPYTGNDKDVLIRASVWEQASFNMVLDYKNAIRSREIDGIDFTNGNATIEWGPEPEGFVGEWSNNDSDRVGFSVFRFNEDGTWNVWYYGIRYTGTYTSSGKTAEMTITSAPYGDNKFIGLKGVGTITVNKLKVTGFEEVKYDGFALMDGEFYFIED